MEKKLEVKTFTPSDQCYGNNFTDKINAMINKFYKEHPEYTEKSRKIESIMSQVIINSWSTWVTLQTGVTVYTKNE